MTRMSEGLILGCLISGLGVTTLLIYKTERSKPIPALILDTLILYKSEIAILIVTIVSIFLAAFFFKKKTYQKEKVSLNCTKKVSVDEYEKTKKVLTDDAVKKLVESEAFKKYVEEKNNNRLREVELTESDKIILSDDSSDNGEEEKDQRRQ